MRRWPLVVLALVVLALGVLVWLSIHDDPPAVVTAKHPVALPAEPPPEPPSIEVADAGVAQAPEREAPALEHLADPCLALRDPDWPSEYQSITQHGITIAWPSGESRFHPAVLAGTVRGILDEAADVTGMPPREKLAVVVHPTQEVYLARTHGPAWSGGLYDGAAVQVMMTPSGDVGVKMTALRHEVMHAHLHATVGCMPAWFNEGMAMWFAGETPIHDFVALLRDAGPVEPALDGGTVSRLDLTHASRAYATSLARIVYISAHGGGDVALRDVAAAIRVTSGHGRAAVAKVWETLFPRADHRAVLDTLARKLFGLPLGPDLDTQLRGPMCCAGYSDLATLACRPVQAQTQSGWVDRETRAACRNQW